MKCSICKRETPFIEHHHLVPKNKKSEKIEVCTDCGDQIHLLFTHQELHYDYNTLEKLLANEKFKNGLERKKNLDTVV